MTDEDKFVQEKALEHARAMGCDCEPDISYTKTTSNGVMNLRIAHDKTCALMTTDNKE